MDYTTEQFINNFIRNNDDDVEAYKKNIKNNKTILHKNIGNFNNLKILLKLGANIYHKDKDGYTVLSLAIMESRIDQELEIVELLLKYGIQNLNNEINEIRTILESKNICFDCTSIILEYATPKIMDGVMEAIFEEDDKFRYIYVEIIKLMLKYGIDVNFQDRTGNTLLMSVIGWLLYDYETYDDITDLIHTMCSDYKVDINIKNDSDETVIDLAKEFYIYEDDDIIVDEDNDIVALLESYQK